MTFSTAASAGREPSVPTMIALMCGAYASASGLITTIQQLPAAPPGAGRSRLVVIATTPEVVENLVAECAAAGVPRVRLDRGIGPGSMSKNAVASCREHGIAVTPARSGTAATVARSHPKSWCAA
jgi:hypothetical protein